MPYDNFEDPELLRANLNAIMSCKGRDATNGGPERHQLAHQFLCPRCYASSRYLRSLDETSIPTYLGAAGSLNAPSEDDYFHQLVGILTSSDESAGRTPMISGTNIPFNLKTSGHGSHEGMLIHELEDTEPCQECKEYDRRFKAVKEAYLGTESNPYNPLNRIENEVQKVSDHHHNYAAEGVLRPEGRKYSYTTDLPVRAAHLYVPAKIAKNQLNGNKCDHCGKSLYTLGLYIAHVHHVDPLYSGKRITNLDDLKVVHPQCHRDMHIAMEDAKAVESGNNE